MCDQSGSATTYIMSGEVATVYDAEIGHWCLHPLFLVRTRKGLLRRSCPSNQALIHLCLVVLASYKNVLGNVETLSLEGWANKSLWHLKLSTLVYIDKAVTRCGLLYIRLISTHWTLVAWTRPKLYGSKHGTHKMWAIEINTRPRSPA